MARFVSYSNRNPPTFQPSLLFHECLSLLTNVHLRLFLSTVSTRTSEGVIAYYWSQFDIPVEDLEIVPEFSEERVLETLELGIAERRSEPGSMPIQISEITASCRYPQTVCVGVCVGVFVWRGGLHPRGIMGLNWVFATSGSRRWHLTISTDKVLWIKTWMRSLSSHISILYTFYLYYRSSLWVVLIRW